MKANSILGLLMLLITSNSIAQIFNPVQWNFSSKHLGGDEFLLIYEAIIDDGWAVYSQYLESDEGPVATSINYEDEGLFELVETAIESGHKKEGFDAMFDMNVIKFTEDYRIEQKIKFNGDKPITGYINFMTCDDTRCLPPKDVDFSFTLKASRSDGENQSDFDGNAGIAEEESDLEDLSSVPPSTEEQGPIILDLNNYSPENPGGGIFEPVTWTASYNASGNPSAVFNVEIQEGWHIYGQEIDGDGPTPTGFIIGNKKVVLDENTPFAKEEADEFFEGIVIKKIKETATFTLQLKDAKTIEGEIEYMACDVSRCLPPKFLPFIIDKEAGTVLLGDEIPLGTEIEIASIAGQYPIEPNNVNEPIGKCGPVQDVKSKGIWSIFILGFLGGLFAIVTPCVFPMIPLTVSFFTKGSENRKKGLKRAMLYGAFILVVYLILSLPFHLLDSVNPGILNEISTNVFLNILFFLIFLFFAFSFFGYYELTLPSNWTNKVSNAEGVGGVLGIFFMALTLALVSFSCTGPILGTLLAGALTSEGGAIQLTAGMGGFGFALALPFALFAAFPAWLSSLPKSGGWLTTVKVTLGFLELAMAFKFLSNADLVKRWGLLKIEPFLAIWIIIFVGLAAYLFGKIKFPHDSPVKKLSFLRASTGILSLAFALYMMSGFRVNQDTGTFTSLTVLSGLAPPTGYSWLHPNDCPNDLDCFKDLEKGIAHAQKVNKPYMIDFTGHACVNCRKMEEHVWPNSEIIAKLREDIVLISLYVDEKIELPEAEQVTVNKKSGGTQKLRTYGNKWEYFQSEYFNNNSQPYYVLLSPDGKLLNSPVGYTPNVDDYADFLNCGLDVFESMQRKIGMN